MQFYSILCAIVTSRQLMDPIYFKRDVLCKILVEKALYN